MNAVLSRQDCARERYASASQENRKDFREKTNESVPNSDLINP